MAEFFYSNVAVTTALSGSVNDSATSMSVDATTGFPSSFPYVLAVDWEGATEELVKVTAAAGTTLTVERAFGGTSAQSHSAGATVKHVYNAQDATDFRTHEDATSAHGITGDFVDTQSVQSLANKTLVDPTISGATLSGTITGTPTITGEPAFQQSTADELILTSSVTGDIVARLQVTADGSILWGDGSNAGDVTLRREESPVLALDGVMRTYRATSAGDSLSARVTGESFSRWLMSTSGIMTWGDGTGAGDTNLYRSAANSLHTDDVFSAQVETTANAVTAASGWSVEEENGRRTCGIASVSLLLTRTGSSISATSTGGIMGGPVNLCTVNAGWRPANDWSVLVRKAGGDGGAVIETGGTITLFSWSPGGGIQNGESVRISFTYVQ